MKSLENYKRKIGNVFENGWEDRWEKIVEKAMNGHGTIDESKNWQRKIEIKNLSTNIEQAYKWYQLLLKLDSLFEESLEIGANNNNWSLTFRIAHKKENGDIVMKSSPQTLVHFFVDALAQGASFPIRFNWGPEILSAGEKYYLNLFSRLHWVEGRIQDSQGRKPSEEKNEAISDRPLLLLLDEPDTVMHPKWQQKLLHWLVQGLPAIFPNRKIQLILTSHSPFVCADLPKEHLVFLRRKEKRNDPHRKWTAEVVPPDGMANTFGANIHKIFTDTQFLGKNLLGEFANRKIKDLIGRVNDFNGVKKEYEKLRRQLDQIGEDFIRRKLIQQLDEKDESRLTQLEKVMKKLQDRMKKAEEEINQIKGKEGEDGQD